MADLVIIRLRAILRLRRNGFELIHLQMIHLQLCQMVSGFVELFSLPPLMTMFVVVWTVEEELVEKQIREWKEKKVERKITKEMRIKLAVRNCRQVVV